MYIYKVLPFTSFRLSFSKWKQIHYGKCGKCGYYLRFNFCLFIFPMLTQCRLLIFIHLYLFPSKGASRNWSLKSLATLLPYKPVNIIHNPLSVVVYGTKAVIKFKGFSFIVSSSFAIELQQTKNTSLLEIINGENEAGDWSPCNVKVLC